MLIEHLVQNHPLPEGNKRAAFLLTARFLEDRDEYDVEADVLYLHIGDPSRAVDFDETPEGHAVRFDREGNVVGLTLVRPKRPLERDGELRLTLPVPSDVRAEQLAAALT